MTRFGWWTTGRDEAAVKLLCSALKAMDSQEILGEISYCFISREKGESRFSDEIADIAMRREIPCLQLSARRFEPGLRERDRKAWRDVYHERVLEIIRPYGQDLAILAGYMWVVSEQACRALKLLNLHPALPGGPQGTWQEVIWKLLEVRAKTTGAMMHLVTPELDKGPPVAFFSFPITGPQWDPLWHDLEERIKELGSLEAVKSEVGEALPIFKKIRTEGERRELPLIVATMGAISRGEIDLDHLEGGPLELKL